MKIIIGLVFAMMIWVLLFAIMYVVISIGVYLYQECVYSMRNAKRKIRQAAWDFEWMWKLMKGR